MLTYDDCLGLSGLTPEEIAAIAEHEHVPAIVALEMGWCLASSPEGKRAIRRLIRDDVERAGERGGPRAAAEPELVPYRFAEARPDRHAPAELDRPAAAAPAAAAAPPAEPSRGDRDHPARAPGIGTTAAPWVRERVDAYLTAMLHRHGLDRASLRTRFRSETHLAETRCATCPETGRCRRFLAGAVGSEAPSTFCPNAGLFAELQRHGTRSRRARAAA